MQAADANIPVMMKMTGKLLLRQAYPNYCTDADRLAHKRFLLAVIGYLWAIKMGWLMVLISRSASLDLKSCDTVLRP